MKHKKETRREAYLYIDFSNTFRNYINDGNFEIALDLLEEHVEFNFPNDPYLKSVDELAQLALNSATDSGAYGYALKVAETYFPLDDSLAKNLAIKHASGLLRLYEASGNPFLKESSDVNIRDIYAYSKEIKNDLVDIWSKYFKNEDFTYNGKTINLPFEVSIIDIEHKLAAWYDEYSQAQNNKNFLIETEWWERLNDANNHISYILEKPLGIDLYFSFN